jgi:stearoyl-CoA desaturase (delta-9 desaturase)
VKQHSLAIGQAFITGGRTVLSWFDTHAQMGPSEPNSSVLSNAKHVDWFRVVPFLFMHIMCLGVIWVGWSPIAVAMAFGLYLLRMLAITGFYHRYFSHKSFKTSRAIQFLFAVLGASAGQRGPLWWASHHRHHHINSDKPSDAHSPKQHGFLWSHIGWFMSRDNFPPKLQRIPDLVKFRELIWLDRFDIAVPIALAIGIYSLGEYLAATAPGLGTNGPQLLIWGFFISTILLYHATYTVNSLAHQIGKRRYNTRDDSRNSFFVALITCGEGWHNNHHHYPGSARQGFYWWEIDITYYFLKLLAASGIIWDLKQVPANQKHSRLVKSEAHHD